MKVATAKDLRDLLRKYNVVLVGDVGLPKAYAKFLKDTGSKRLPPTEGQKEVRAHLIHCGVFDDPRVLVLRAMIELRE